MSTKKKLLQAAAGGGVAGDPVYIEDIHSTYVYIGDASGSLTIDNGIDLSTDGGAVLFKQTNSAQNWFMFDTEMGFYSGPSTPYWTKTNATSAATYAGGFGVESFNTNGFTLGNGYNGVNTTGDKFVSYSFKKTPKFFDLVKYTGNGQAGRVINHSLDCEIGTIIVKCISQDSHWVTWHKDSYQSGTSADVSFLNESSVSQTGVANVFEGFSTSSFTVGNNSSANGDTNTHVNKSGQEYVAYIFAHNSGGNGGFGENQDQDVIRCGSWSASSSKIDIDVGFEPQIVLVKAINGSANPYNGWQIFDNMRGMGYEAETPQNVGHNTPLYLYNNTAEGDHGGYGGASYDLISVTPTGFRVNGTSGPSSIATGGTTMGYIAIRRGPMRLPEAGTDCFETYLTPQQQDPQFRTNWPVDMTIHRYNNTSSNNAHALSTRLCTHNYSLLNGNSAIASSGLAVGATSAAVYDYMNGVGTSQGLGYGDDFCWMWRRYPHFFDLVSYEGDGSNNRAIPHNLGIQPSLMFIKNIENGGYHIGWNKPTNRMILLDLPNEQWSQGDSATYWGNDGTGTVKQPTDTHFYVGSQTQVNGNTNQLIAMLFGEIDGISKVGSYVGNATDTTIDCGFTAGARFVLIKNMSNNDNWKLFDTVRGWTTSTDYWMELNQNFAQQSGNTLLSRNQGFGVRGSSYDAANINTNGDTYLFYAIA